MSELMDENEFRALVQRLHDISAVDGDLGHAYWTRVIGQLCDMRTLALQVNPLDCATPPGQ